tara:strand:- start:16403 stop:17683 length:1281 start_codon:yes stop_codon:yes gene_type:complete
MTNASIPTLLLIMLILLVLSAFFSGSETGMMSINRFRLKHLSKNSKAAKRVQKMLERPDRLLGVILLGNNFVNIMASAIASIIAIRLWGDMGVLVASILLTIIVLIFAEVSPKTLAALYPEKIAFPASNILKVLLVVLYPLVWLVNIISNSLLRLIGVNIEEFSGTALSKEELRTIVHETSGRGHSTHRSMLLGILDLEKVHIEDIMIPRNEIIGIDLTNDWDAIKGQLASTQHTFLPVYEENLNDIVGVMHVKHALHLLANKESDKNKLKKILMVPYFVPEGTTLAKQLVNFKEHKKRLALVVDEYGDLEGLITLEDIFEEIVGEFTTDMASETHQDVHPQEDGTILIDGGATLRDINKSLGLNFSLKGPKTLSGLIVDYLQTIPSTGTCCVINNIIIEVIQVQDNRIKTIKILLPTPDKDTLET